VNFIFDTKGFDTLAKQLDPAIALKATVRTLNEEGRRFGTQTVKHVREEYNIKASTLKSYIKQNRANKNELEFTMVIRSSPLSLSRFGLRSKNIRTKRGMRKGVTVKVFRKKKRKIVKHAFSPTGKQIFKREGSKRLPISKLTTLSAPQMFKSDTIEDGYETVEQHLPKTFERNYNFYLSKIK